MTNEEAIEVIKKLNNSCGICGMMLSVVCNEAKEIAINSIQENTKLKDENERLKQFIDNQKKLYEYRIDLQLKYNDRNHEEIESLKSELEQSVKCINDTWMFTEEIIGKAKKRDLSMFRIAGISGCDMYQGCPPICRIHDSLFEKHEEIIHKSIKAVQEEAERH